MKRVALLFALWLTGVSATVQTGADRLTEEPYLALIRGKRVGLITNPTGVNRQLESTIEVLRRLPDVQLTALFGPEHGILGNTQAGQTVESQATIYSLYGETRSPLPEMLANVDVLIFDIQDVGARFYTFIATMFESMRAAARAGLPFIVLDRPVPINGVSVEGPVVASGFESFVGIFPLPIRHGMTVGELAGLFNAEVGMGCDLTVVPLKHWQRKQWFDETGLPWIPPSPNMPTQETATVYPGMCLIEGTNLSEGRGTTRPFEWIGAPWLDHKKLASTLNRLALPGVHFREQTFIPWFSKFEGETCRGVQIHVTDRDRFQPIRTVLHLLSEVRKLHSGQLEFRAGFDRLAGNSWIREKLQNGEAPQVITETWQPELTRFLQTRARYLLYPRPTPASRR